jgi:ubiquinol oxidase
MAQYEYTIGKELDLKQEQVKTLASPVLPSNFILKGMYLFFDLIYGQKRTPQKFIVLEILARYPYWVWESAGYRALSMCYSTTSCPTVFQTKEILKLIELGRESQDNEQWHLLLLADICYRRGYRFGWFHFYLVPKILVLKYRFLTKLIYMINPSWSFAMNAAFESHAEHQYMLMAQENPEWDNEPVDSTYFEYYPRQKTLNDLIRRIALDERDHMYHSLEALEKHQRRRR